MQLGPFSLSLSVEDIHASKEFYAKLGFEPICGEIEQKWLVLQNDRTTIGLFQGMFEGNILTFNPGWDHQQKALSEFDDVRTLQAEMEKSGLEIHKRAEEDGDGPASFVLMDPDGNTILVDQHVPSPKAE